jgi:hypothetical protein
VTLTELRAFVRSAVLEKATDKGLIPSDADLDLYLHAAHKAIYDLACKWNPRPWMERSADHAYANPLPLATLAGAGKAVREVYLLCVKDGAGYRPLTPREAGYLDFADLEEGVSAAANPSQWYVEGVAIWLTPPPARAAVLRASFVREVGAIGANDQLLGGRLGDHHELIGFKGAQLVYRKDEQLRTPWDVEVEERLRALRSALARNQGQRTRRIRRASHFPNTRRR